MSKKMLYMLSLVLMIALVMGNVLPVMAQTEGEPDGPQIESDEESQASRAAGEGAGAGADEGFDAIQAIDTAFEGTMAEDADVAEPAIEETAASEAAIPTAEDAVEPIVPAAPEMDSQLFLPQITGSGGTDDGIGPFELEAAASAGGAGSNTILGDFNGDGMDDLAVGVPFENVGAIVDAGAVNVLYGSPHGVSTNDQFWHQNSAGILGVAETGDRFGYALAVGNFNGDRFDDLAIGVPYENYGPAATDDNRGVINVLYGSNAGLTAAGDQYWHQDRAGIRGAGEPDDKFGYSLAVGNFNGDQYDDLAIGVPEEDIVRAGVNQIDAGAVNVMYGSAARLQPAGNQMWYQDSTGIHGASEFNDVFGYSLSSGDFDMDQYDDLAIGVPLEDLAGPAKVNVGAVNVLYGSGGRLTATGNQLWHQDTGGILGWGEKNDRFGMSLSAGDFNGNGRDDLAIGVPLEDLAGPLKVNMGAVNVLYGVSGPGLTSAGDQLFNQDVAGISDVGEPGDSFGISLASGDFNRDGRDDLAVGVPYEDIGTLKDAGVVHVIQGSGGGLTAAGDQYWNQNIFGIYEVCGVKDLFGWSLFVGDFDRNWADDLAIGVPYEDLSNAANKQNVGGVNVIYGVPFAGLVSLGDQFWSQDTPGILDVAEAGDKFGEGR